MSVRTITYAGLNATFRKGLRNGNWRKLRFMDKALYRAAMGYARYGRSIVNGKLVEKLLGLIEKLKETKGMRNLNLRGDLKEQRGCSRKAKRILRACLYGLRG